MRGKVMSHTIYILYLTEVGELRIIFSTRAIQR